MGEYGGILMKIKKEVIDYIARISDGCMRESIGKLERVLSYPVDGDTITIQDALEALGNYSYEVFFKMCNSLIDGDEKSVLEIISNYYDKGNDLKLFVSQFLDFCIDLTKYALFKTCDVTRIPTSMEDSLKYSTGFDSPEKYYSYVIDKLLSLKNMIKNEVDVRSTVEVVLLQIARGR